MIIKVKRVQNFKLLSYCLPGIYGSCLYFNPTLSLPSYQLLLELSYCLTYNRFFLYGKQFSLPRVLMMLVKQPKPINMSSHPPSLTAHEIIVFFCCSLANIAYSKKKLMLASYSHMFVMTV